MVLRHHGGPEGGANDYQGISTFFYPSRLALLARFEDSAASTPDQP